MIYSNAISATISTVPSHASIFTGTHVSTHGLFLDGDRLSYKLITLAEYLKEIGYNTFGICYQDDVSPITGLHRGFQKFDMNDDPGFFKNFLRNLMKTKKPLQYSSAKKYLGSSETLDGNSNNSILKTFKSMDIYKKMYWYFSSRSDQGAMSSQRKIYNFLQSQKKNTPFFIYLHYDETHLPYRPIHPYRSIFLNKKSLKREPWQVNQDRHKFFLNKNIMDNEDFEILRSLYDASIMYLDKKTYDLYEMLTNMKLLENTIFIIIGDHGDNLGEHGLLSHKYCVYDTLIKVPMFIKYPKEMNLNGHSKKVVHLTDILPTLLDILYKRKHPIIEQLEGNSLISENIKNRYEQIVISELIKPFGNDIKYYKTLLKEYNKRMFSVRSDKFKFIWNSSGDHEFYDLINDSHEALNIINDKTKISKEFLAIAQKHEKKFNTCFNDYKYFLE